LPGQQSERRQNKEQPHDRGNPSLRSALTECAWAAAATKNCSLRDKFWSVRSRSGGKKAPALIAVAHVMPTLIYKTLEARQPFVDRKGPPLGATPKERMIRHHIRRLGNFGITLHRTALIPAALKTVDSK
jgi:transposase